MNIKSVLAVIIMFGLSLGTQAQESKEEKKVVIIKKKDENGKITEKRAEGKEAEELMKSMEKDGINIETGDKKIQKVIVIRKNDENGEVTEERIEAEGNEVDELLKSLEKDGISIDRNMDGDHKIMRMEKEERRHRNRERADRRGEKEIEITSEIKDGERKERYKIIRMDGDKENVIEWEGDGEMPEEISKELGNMKMLKEIEGDNITITMSDDEDMDDMEVDDEVHVIRRGRNDGKKRMMWIGKDDNVSFPNSEDRFEFNTDKPTDNKVSLGVMIEDTDNGVVISDIVPGSSAESAGLRRGDVILKVSDTYIFTSNGLLSALRPYNPNEKVKVKYIREGKEKSTSAVLKARN